MGKYDKYICTELKKRHMLPGPTPEVRDQIDREGKHLGMEHVLWIDDEVIPGAYYGESTWIWPAHYPNVIPWEEAMKLMTNPTPMFPHAHDFPEILSWWGTDPDHPEDTTSMGMLMEDEEIPLDRSWAAYIPAGMPHMPTRRAGKVTRQTVCHWTSGPGGVYTREKDEPPTAAKHEPVKIKKMKPGEGRNAKYFVYGGEKHGKIPDYLPEMDPRYSRRMAYIDEKVIPGAEFGCDFRFLLPGDKSKAGQLIMKPHTMPYGTSIVINCMNFGDVTDLCAEAELWIGGEKHIIKKSFGAYIPPDMERGPLVIRDIKKQLMFMTSHPIGEGIKKYRGR